jgi:hypothetical protein
MGRIKSLWLNLLSFLRRDLRSFRGGSRQELPNANVGKPAPEQLDPLPSEINFQKLDQLRFRRDILDWRDEFHVRIGALAEELFSQFSSYVENKVAEVGIFRRLFTKPAGEILQTPFDDLVRVELTKRVKEAEESLAQILSKWPTTIWPPFSFTEQNLDSRLACLDEIGLKPTNQEEILDRMDNLISGEGGLVETYRSHATSIARKLIQTFEATA